MSENLKSSTKTIRLTPDNSKGLKILSAELDTTIQDLANKIIARSIKARYRYQKSPATE